MTSMPREKDALPNDSIPSNDATDGAAASNGGASQKDEMSAGNDTSKRPASDAEIAHKADEMTARAYERSRERIMERFADKEVARDIVTLAGMTEIYCADHHDDALRTPSDSEAVRAGVYPARKIPRLCPECAAHTAQGHGLRRPACDVSRPRDRSHPPPHPDASELNVERPVSLPHFTLVGVIMRTGPLTGFLRRRTRGTELLRPKRVDASPCPARERTCGEEYLEAKFLEPK